MLLCLMYRHLNSSMTRSGNPSPFICQMPKQVIMRNAKHHLIGKFLYGRERNIIREANSPFRESTPQQCSRLNVHKRSMPICISCSTPVNNLYTTYSKADDRSLGKGVRLTQCPRCKRFADKYVEHDFVVLFIDLVLIKPQVRDLQS